MCIRNKNIGNAALASTTKNRALLAESRQWLVAENPPAIFKPQKIILLKKYILKKQLVHVDTFKKLKIKINFYAIEYCKYEGLATNRYPMLVTRT